MFRSLSTKLVVAVLAAVIVPFAGFAYFLDSQIDTRLREDIVRHSLLGLATDLAKEIDRMLAERNAELALLASDMLGDWAVEEYRHTDAAEPTGEGAAPETLWGPASLATWAAEPDFTDPWAQDTLWRRNQTAALDRFVRLRRVYDVVLLVAPDGRLVTCSSRSPAGRVWSRETLEALFATDFSGASWFRAASAGSFARVDHHRSAFLPPPPEGADPALGYHVGFAAPVSRFLLEGEVAGVLYALVSWSHVQELVDVPEIKAYFSGLVRDKEPSPYAWIWGSDADTIIAHQDRSLYGERVSGPRVSLPQMVEDARGAPVGSFREYTFRGVRKNAAFHHCRGPDGGPLEGGFGWVVGVGIDNHDIYAMSAELQSLLYRSTAVVLLTVVLWTLVVARRTTRPILTLQQHARRVAGGDLETEVHVGGQDELAALAADFNVMTRELKAKNAQLIRAEKDAAWREMARQIAHDIKNPLTPIKLSIDLLKRARAEGSPSTEKILDRTLELVENQVQNLREIASDFYDFTGGRPARPEPLDLAALLAEVLDLHRAWAQELGVEVHGERDLPRTVVLADRTKLRRVLANLVSNALQAMPEGGRLAVSLRGEGQSAVLEVRDSGLGLSEEVRRHLFEPYFTTRSEGTGLGLAIAKRVVEESGGTIELVSAEGGGTLARVRLPSAPAPGEPA